MYLTWRGIRRVAVTTPDAYDINEIADEVAASVHETRPAKQIAAAMAPISRILADVLKDAVAAGSIKVADTQRAALLIQQTVMYGWLMNRFVPNPRAHVTAEDAWEFCLHGLAG